MSRSSARAHRSWAIIYRVYYRNLTSLCVNSFAGTLARWDPLPWTETWDVAEFEESCACVCTWRDVKLLTCWISGFCFWICFPLHVSLQGDHPCTACDSPTKRPQYMRISRLITVTYLQVVFTAVAWGLAENPSPTLSFRGLHVCRNLDFLTFFSELERGRVSFQFNLFCAGYGDGSFLILCRASSPTHSCKWKCFCM